MRLQLKYLIDTLLGRPLVAALNVLAYPLGKILHRDHSIETTRVIVLCKLMGLGSIVQITPLIAALRERFPEARIVFLTRKANQAYCERLHVITETLAIDDGSLMRLGATMWAALRRIWAQRADLFINLEVYSNLGALLAITSCARNRVGYYMTPRDQRAWGIYTHMVYFNRSAPIAEVYLQAARCLGIEVLDDALVPPRVTPDDVATLHRTLARHRTPDSSYILVNPNSSELSHERRWPAASFAELMRRVHATHPEHQFIIIGGPGEEATGAELSALMADAPQFPLTDLSGQLSMPELIALIQGARALITNDSGPMHLAFSLRVPTVALFGPVSPAHYGGTQATTRAMLYHHLYCSPCVHHFLVSPCGGDNQCMKLITPDEVVGALEAVLSGSDSLTSAAPFRYCAKDRIFGARSRGKPYATH